MITVLDDLALSVIREAAGNLFNARCDIQTPPTVARDSNGGVTAGTYTTAASAVACSIQPISAREREIAQRLGMVADYVAYLPALQAVTARQRLVSGGVTYEVIGVTPRQDTEVVRKVYAVVKDSP